VLTPIASHSLGARPIVLSDTTEVKIEVSSRSHNFLIAIDGRNESCNENAALTIKKAPHSLRLIRCKGQSFIKNLRDKMMWGADIR
jgi:NAD+ kinase